MKNTDSKIELLPIQIKRSLMSALAFAALTTTGISKTVAQDLLDVPLYEDWYQVELVIFKRADNASESLRENWPKNLALAFPPNVQHLFQANKEGTTEADAIVESSTETHTLATEDATSDEIRPSSNAHTPFELLSEEGYIIKNAARALKRESGVAVLFHESWLQPMKSLKDAPALVIRGGDTFGEHRELEGTVTLSLSRYLHIHTDLWLTQFVANYGQQSEHWPELPAPPTAIETTDSNATETPAFDEAIELTDNNETLVIDLAGQDSFTTGNSSHNLDTGLNNFTSLADEPFLIKEIISLNQKRRMRSEELHYIDHPRMGVLIKIIRFTTEPKLQEQ